MMSHMCKMKMKLSEELSASQTFFKTSLCDKLVEMIQDYFTEIDVHIDERFPVDNLKMLIDSHRRIRNCIKEEASERRNAIDKLVEEMRQKYESDPAALGCLKIEDIKKMTICELVEILS